MRADRLGQDQQKWVDPRGRERWIEARPIPGPLGYRLRDAWAVLRGRAEALYWPPDAA